MYLKFRGKAVDESIREDFVFAFTEGDWSEFREYGDREGSEEPCVMSQNAMHPTHGLYPYQAAYWLKTGKVPPKRKVLCHRCRNVRNTKETRCCTVSHMLIKTQSEDRSRSKDHKAIIKKANRKMKMEPGPLRTAMKIGDDCKHRGSDGKECCIVSYGERADTSDSVTKYVLCTDRS